jgi:cell division septum initiation protein DivIVA
MFRRAAVVPGKDRDREGDRESGRERDREGDRDRGGAAVVGELLPEPAHIPGDLDALLSTQPCFRGALRGYDRSQVDNYVAWAEAEMVAMRRQADQLLTRHGAALVQLEAVRRRLVRSSRGRDLSSASDRVQEMLRLAAEEASRIAAAGAEEAERILAEARLEADARLRKVHEIKRAAIAAADQLREQARTERAEAAGVLERARRQAQELLRDASAERDRLTAEAADARARLTAVQEEVDDLRRQRDEARQLLRRLTDQIGSALDAVTAVVPNERVVFDNNVAQLTGK